MADTRDIIVKLLRNLGGRKEVEQYLKHYCGVATQKFAVIQAPLFSLGDQFERVATSLSFLSQVGLRPIVVHGDGKGSFAKRFVEHGVVVSDRHVYTPPEKMPAIAAAYEAEANRLVASLERRGVEAIALGQGVFQGEPYQNGGASAAKVVKVDPTSVVAALEQGKIPIVGPLVREVGDQTLRYTDVVDAAAAAAREFSPHKIIFLNRDGGLFGDDGTILSAINLAEDFDRFSVNAALPAATKKSMARAKRILDGLSVAASVSIASPEQLARELFTHRGAGTLVRKGERVLRFDDFGQVDVPRLRALIESCFGRPLSPDYFDQRRCEALYVTDEYRGTAVVTREAGTPYLDKFAVSRKAQGEGLGSSVWNAMKQHHPAIFWRAQTNNPVNQWYFSQADGSFRTDKWTVFWCGMDNFSVIKTCVERALSLPATLKDHGSNDE